MSLWAAAAAATTTTTTTTTTVGGIGPNFPEISLKLAGDAAYDVNVLAGAEGMTCLTFNGETIRVLLTSPAGL